VAAVSREAVEALALVRALSGALVVLDGQLAQAVVAASRAGVDGMRLASALGVSRSTLYRRYLDGGRDG
jgi:hypothetical protein